MHYFKHVQYVDKRCASYAGVSIAIALQLRARNNIFGIATRCVGVKRPPENTGQGLPFA
jgi:hypothetical protein